MVKNVVWSVSLMALLAAPAMAVVEPDGRGGGSAHTGRTSPAVDPMDQRAGESDDQYIARLERMRRIEELRAQIRQAQASVPTQNEGEGDEAYESRLDKVLDEAKKQAHRLEHNIKTEYSRGGKRVEDAFRGFKKGWNGKKRK